MFIKRNQKFGDWTVISNLGAGGNGEVWIAQNSGGNKAAIKILKKLKQIAYSRFVDECKVIRENQDIKGVMPIFDFYLPGEIGKELPWYVMPIAVPISEQLIDKNAEEILIAIIEIGDTLSELHKKNITHRDIKPPNLFWFDDRYCIGDFGLVDYPEKKDLTPKGGEVGPKWTMAPEMRRDPDKADGKCADVYSLAKTLWILLTNEKKGFEGQYKPDHFIGIGKFQQTIFPNPFDDLIRDCTENDPLKRPSIMEVVERLKNGIEINRSYEEKNRVQWIAVQRNLFPTALPSRVIWENINDIISVLKNLSFINLNHMFFPNGGGLDLENVSKSFEDNCLELGFSGSYIIVKPKRLIFESFGDNPEWNYFRLETGDLISFDPSYTKYNDEMLTELEPGLYTDYNCFEYNDFNGEPLPSTARPIRRIFNGDFVIFQKTSLYNKNRSTYDGRHNKMNADQFRKHIYSAIQYNKKDIKSIIISSDIKDIRYIKPDIFRQNERILTSSELKLLNEIITMAIERDLEDDGIRAKFGISDHYSFGDEKVQKYLLARRPKGKALDKYLTMLAQPELEIIVSVMYGGRDCIVGGRTLPFQEMLKDSKGHHNLVETLTEKAPLAEYLKAGIKAYSDEFGHTNCRCD